MSTASGIPSIRLQGAVVDEAIDGVDRARREPGLEALGLRQGRGASENPTHCVADLEPGFRHEHEDLPRPQIAGSNGGAPDGKAAWDPDPRKRRPDSGLEAEQR